MSVQVGLAILGITKLKPSRILSKVSPQIFDGKDPGVMVVAASVV